ncbi:MAG TPA: hypothetical protein VL919_05765, partial [Vicinamibacterales bacterium]|nr:hypothetical protein [Vicinamibacterales bacterium]
MRRRHIAIISLAVTAAAWAPMRSIRAQSANPCVAALASESPSVQRAAVSRELKSRFGADTRDIHDLLQLSALATQTRALDAADLRARPASTARPAADVNDIAVLEDNGDLILRANPFDLANSGVRFEPNGSSYVVSAAGSEFRTPLGRAITLGDDDTATQTLAAPLTFYGRPFTSLFINSDGNVTFDEGDNASTARGLARLTGGPPRMAPFFADLDPSAGGRVYFNATSDTVTVTWCAVPGFELAETVTAQVVVQSSGAIEFRFGTTDLGNGIVALSPGAAGSFTPVNLNRAEPVSGDPGAIGERFSRMQSLDLVAASRRFYETHADAFDQLVFWTDSPVIEDAFAFETTVQNAITGIGQEVFDAAPILGSAGVLQSVVNMDRVSKYGDTPSAKLFGEMSPLGILAHETGHRWLARLMFRNADRTVSDQLLGRQLAHWSFFMDSDGSVMEGNEIEDQRGGVFRTAAAPERYSRLDMYAMGLATEAEVAPWFFIDSPVSTRTRETPPSAGVTINGTRRDVLIQDVIAALGPRVPSAGDSPRVHRQAFVFIRR